MRCQWRRECLKTRSRAAWIGGWFTVCLVVAGPVPAVAGVFRCPDGEGGVVFQQTPCPQGVELELDVRATEWVASPGLQPLQQRKRTGSAARQRSALARAAREERKQKQACWKARQRIERIEAELRHGYKPSKGERLRRQRREQSDYLRAFCR